VGCKPIDANALGMRAYGNTVTLIVRSTTHV
jgi:hypothetical protein